MQLTVYQYYIFFSFKNPDIILLFLQDLLLLFLISFQIKKETRPLTRFFPVFFGVFNFEVFFQEL